VTVSELASTKKKLKGVEEEFKMKTKAIESLIQKMDAEYGRKMKIIE